MGGINRKRIVLTGGGTAGHVSPNLALVPALKADGWEIEYIGSHKGIEKSLVEAQSISYHAISSGKLRRYFDWRNFTDPFSILLGVFQAFYLLFTRRPQVVFSKGGFVTVPVVFAAWLLRIPALIHESDLSPGLANRLCIPFAARICYSFPETIRQLPMNKSVHTGTPIRAELLQGEASRGLAAVGFEAGGEAKPVLLVMGGSLGSRALNHAVRAIMPALTARFRVIHLCGKGGRDPALEAIAGYRQFEFLGKELPDVFAASDLVLSRAGANALFELLALRKPHLLVPLSRAASRGDQILNAAAFERLGYSRVVQEEELKGPDRLLLELEMLWSEREERFTRMGESPIGDAAEIILAQIRNLAG